MRGVAKRGLGIVVSILIADTSDLDESGDFFAGINLTIMTLMFPSLRMERLTTQVLWHGILSDHVQTPFRLKDALVEDRTVFW